MRHLSVTAMCLIAVLVLTVATSIFSFREVSRSVDFGNKIDGVSHASWSALAGLLDQDQGINGLAVSRSPYFLHHFQTGRAEFTAAYQSIDSFLSEERLNKAMAIHRRILRLYEAWLAQVAFPIASGKAQDANFRQLQGQVQIDGIQTQLLALQKSLYEESDNQQIITKQRILLTDVALVLLSGALALSSIVLDSRRRRKEAGYVALLADRSTELERSNAALQDFAYVASHDLQEPLRMVASYTQLLGRRYKGKLDADADEFIGFAVDGAKRMQRLINDVLSYSRLSSRPPSLMPTECDKILQQALANVQGSVQECGASINASPLPQVLGEEGQLVQLFQNLIGNGLKYRKPGVAPVMSITADREGNRFRFAIRDNGIGIPPEHAERIFRMFQRLHSAGEYSGTGIGLALCKRIVERHGGTIWVESIPDQGATFCFTLPAA